MSNKLRYRPHHFMCTVGYQGKGYSPKFERNFNQIVAKLRDEEGDSTEIEVVEYTDDICDPCPHRRSELCEVQSKIESLDQRHAKVLGLKVGDVLTWKNAKARIKNNVSEEIFQEMCKGCEWQSLGVCQQALVALRKES